MEFAQVKKANGLKVLTIYANAHLHGSNAHMVDLGLLHRCLAHLHIDGIRELLKQQGVESSRAPYPPCEACSLAKSSRIICRIPQTHATHPFGQMHIDLCGQITTPGIGNRYYFLFFTDDFTRYYWVVCLTNKGQVLGMIQQFYTSVKNQYQSEISEIHGDNGSKFGGKAFDAFLAEKGIKFILMTPYHHHQNNIVERSHGVITERATTMIIGAHLPRSLWPKVVQATVYVTNRTPT